MRNDYKKEDFKILTDPETGKRRYFVRVNKNKRKFYEVDKKIYSVYYNSYKKIYRDNLKDNDAKLISLDYSLDNGVALIDKIASKESNISYSEKHLLIDMLDKLPQKDRFLIIGLVIIEMSEKEMAEYFRVSQSSISKRKKKILSKLRDMCEEMELIKIK